MAWEDEIDWGSVFQGINQYDDHLRLQAEKDARELAAAQAIQGAFKQAIGDEQAMGMAQPDPLEQLAGVDLRPQRSPGQVMQDRAYRMLDALGAMDPTLVGSKPVQDMMTKYYDLLNEPEKEAMKQQERRDSNLALQLLRGQQGMDKTNLTFDRREQLAQRMAEIKTALPPSNLNNYLAREVAEGRMTIDEAFDLAKKDRTGKVMVDKSGKVYTERDGKVYDADGNEVTNVPGGLRNQSQAEPAPKTPQAFEDENGNIKWVTPGQNVPSGWKPAGTGRKETKDDDSAYRSARQRAVTRFTSNLKNLQLDPAAAEAELNRLTQEELKGMPSWGGGSLPAPGIPGSAPTAPDAGSPRGVGGTPASVLEKRGFRKVNGRWVKPRK